ncbi:MAG: hypothetical protein RLZZ628_3773, partial [Bacteroidota bacterium]
MGLIFYDFLDFNLKNHKKLN